MRNTFFALTTAFSLHASAAEPTRESPNIPKLCRIICGSIHSAITAVQENRFFRSLEARASLLTEADNFQPVQENDPDRFVAVGEELLNLPNTWSKMGEDAGGDVHNILLGNPYAEKVAEILSCPKISECYFMQSQSICSELHFDFVLLQQALFSQYPHLIDEGEHPKQTSFCLIIALFQFQNAKRVTGIADAETCAVARDRLPEFFLAQIETKEKKTASAISVSKKKKRR